MSSTERRPLARWSAARWAPPSSRSNGSCSGATPAASSAGCRFCLILRLRSCLYAAVIVVINTAAAWLMSGQFIVIGSVDFLVSLVLVVAGNLLFSVNDLLGPGALFAFAAGRYYHPRIEERALLFIDMRSSTAIAERLGELRFLDLLNRFIVDVSLAVAEAGGEIHKYVGDEVIATWRLAPGKNERGVRPRLLLGARPYPRGRTGLRARIRSRPRLSRRPPLRPGRGRRARLSEERDRADRRCDEHRRPHRRGLPLSQCPRARLSRPHRPPRRAPSRRDQRAARRARRCAASSRRSSFMCSSRAEVRERWRGGACCISFESMGSLAHPPPLWGRAGWGVARIVDIVVFKTGLLNSGWRDPPPLSSPTKGEETR